jgi:hypothetical protein
MGVTTPTEGEVLMGRETKEALPLAVLQPATPQEKIQITAKHPVPVLNAFRIDIVASRRLIRESRSSSSSVAGVASNFL